MAQAHGATKGRTYTLAAAYTRQLGFSNLQHEQMVLAYVRQHGPIRRGDVAELCRISDRQAKDLLMRLKLAGQLVLVGAGRGAVYQEPSTGSEP